MYKIIFWGLILSTCLTACKSSAMEQENLLFPPFIEQNNTSDTQ